MMYWQFIGNHWYTIHIKTQYYLKYINNLFKINEVFHSFLHPQGKIIKEKSYIKNIYSVKINKICITRVYVIPFLFM